MGKYLITIFFLFVLVVATAQFFTLNKQREDLGARIKEKKTELAEMEREKTDTVSEVEYFQNKENLEKEFKSRFNYRKPEEKMYILVP